MIKELKNLQRGSLNGLHKLVSIEKGTGLPSKFKVPKLHIKLWRMRWH